MDASTPTTETRFGIPLNMSARHAFGIDGMDRREVVKPSPILAIATIDGLALQAGRTDPYCAVQHDGSSQHLICARCGRGDFRGTKLSATIARLPAMRTNHPAQASAGGPIRLADLNAFRTNPGALSSKMYVSAQIA